MQERYSGDGGRGREFTEILEMVMLNITLEQEEAGQEEEHYRQVSVR